VVSFLQALFTADGTVRDHPKANGSSVVLTSKSKALLRGVQLLLLNLGIRSRILDRSRPERFTGFTYVTKDGVERRYKSDGVLYELFLHGEARDRFRRIIGFLDEKQARLENIGFPGFRPTVFEDTLVAKEYVGQREVYDLTEPASHSMVASGIVVTQCGEEPLLAFESCNLGAINLETHMKRVGDRWEVDRERLERTTRTVTRFLDNLIDANKYPIPQIEEVTKATRKIGVGVMGFARMLFKLEVPYDSPEGVEWGRRIMRFINEKAMEASQELAEERGVYPAWKGSMHEKMGLRMRNSYVTTVAPTGTICMIDDTSGGCEPEFSLIWYKNVMDGDHLPYTLDYFIEVAKREGFWSPELVDRIVANHGSVRGLKEVPLKWQQVFATAHDITPEWHVRMQAAYQEQASAAISKTCNLPAEATVEDVKKAYLLAYELNCKGITVYRDQSRPQQVMNIGVSEKAKAEGRISEKAGEKPKEEASPSTAPDYVQVKIPPVIKPRPRPDVVTGRTQRIRTGYGNLFVTINEDEFGLVEVFAQIGRGGGYTASFTEAVARLISICLRSGVPVEEIINQLEGIRSPRLAWDHREPIFSVPDALAKALRRHVRGGVQAKLPPVESFDEKPRVVTDTEGEKETRDDTEAIVKAGFNPDCPECGQGLIFEEGCVRCRSCGYSEC
jgi:ribonucleoside-diphosphate reductase alpha chain